MTRPSKKRWFITVASVLGVVILVIAAWGIDTSMRSDRVARGVELLGQPVSGLSGTELKQATARVADEYRGAHVRIISPEGELDTTAAAVGLSMDQPATTAAILDIDRNESVLLKPFNWVRSLVQSRSAPTVFHVDHTTLQEGLKQLDAANRVAPVEPGIVATETGFDLVPGVKGEAINLDEVAAQLEQAAAGGATPVTIQVSTRPVAPKYTDVDAKAVADKAAAITKNPLALSVGGKSATIQSKVLRGWIKAVPVANGLDLQVDQAKVVAELPAFVSDLGTAPVDATVTLVGDPATNTAVPTIIDGQNGTRCCAADSAQRIATALLAGQTSAALDLEPVTPAHDRAWAEGLKIVEPIATFTTRHPAGEPRVINIHKMADTVRGMLIEPGGEFSLNERVGQRTEEKGYVKAPVIYDATHAEDVGGGVSQFATTLFNAGFFGGLDFTDYQSHSLFIDRYPYGREATVSWPKPHLILKNNSPYGVLVWTSYTDTSLTVTLYSTTWAPGEQTNQTQEPKGPCTRVTTERTRTFVADGRRETDKVYALYQPADGVKCP